MGVVAPHASSESQGQDVGFHAVDLDRGHVAQGQRELGGQPEAHSGTAEDVASVELLDLAAVETDAALFPAQRGHEATLEGDFDFPGLHVPGWTEAGHRGQRTEELHGPGFGPVEVDVLDRVEDRLCLCRTGRRGDHEGTETEYAKTVGTETVTDGLEGCRICNHVWSPLSQRHACWESMLIDICAYVTTYAHLDDPSKV